jgi:hypothetical protein
MESPGKKKPISNPHSAKTIIKTTTNALNNYLNVDIRNDKAIIFAPPTKYKLQNGEFCYYTDMGGEILPTPEIIVNNLKQFNKPSQPVKAVSPKQFVEKISDDNVEKKETNNLTKDQELLNLIII